MLNNVKLKRTLKETIFKGASLVNQIIPKKDNKVLLYSGNLGIRHNLLPLKDALLAGAVSYTHLTLPTTPYV